MTRAELGGADADRLAARLGDLPLAVAQAAGFMAETGMPAAQYLDLLRTQAGTLLDQPAPGSSYPRSLAAATRLTADRLEGDDPAAAQLASVCAFLAPEPVPENLFTSAPEELPGELAARAADPLAWRQTWPAWPGSRWPGSTSAGLVMHSSPRPSCGTGSPASRPPPPAHVPRRSWPPPTPATRLILSRGRGGRS